MSTVTEIRDELAARLATISGLRVSSLIPEQITPPMAVVSIDRIGYDLTLGRGADEFTFTVTVLVSRPSERSAQIAIDGFCNSAGTTSVKAAIEADSSLDGSAYDCRVTEMRGVSPVTIGDQAYLAAEFLVTVLAS